MQSFCCEKSKEHFSLSPFELALRKKLNAPLPLTHPKVTFQNLLAFWQHFAIHRRKCDLSGKDIISVFPEDCAYPVWHRDDWIKHANPPSSEVNFSRPFFEQLWELFQTCPIPHNLGLANENCDYTDDWWYSKNCYLSHSGLECEDCHYCYRVYKCRDCQYCVFAFYCELCRDLINCWNCFSVLQGFYSKNCRDSAFLFDCRNCEHCLFCWNLRNKKYCFENKQLTKSEYLKIRAQHDFSSFAVYEKGKERFQKILTSQALWKALEVEKSEHSSGAYIENTKNCYNCYFIHESEDCVTFMRGMTLKDSLECIGCFDAQLVYHSALVQDVCYQIRYCYSILQSKFLEYCGFCFNCKYCFACCGLVGREYCILNRQYSPEEYHTITEKLRKKIADENLVGRFFPPHFAPNSYDESLASFYFPLSREKQLEDGFRLQTLLTKTANGAQALTEIPDHPADAEPTISNKIFWDEEAKRPFQITKFDLQFSKKNLVPLPRSFYIRHIKELFQWMFFNGTLRDTQCAITYKEIQTHLPSFLDGQIVSVQAYLENIDGVTSPAAPKEDA